MKPAIYRVLILMVLLAIPVVNVNAQSTGARFTVPFEFMVNGNTMPAGDYFIEGLWWNAVAFHNVKGEPGLVVLAQYAPRTQEDQTKLIFHRYGDKHFLASAELPNTNHGRAFQTDVVSHTIKVQGTVSQARPEIIEIRGK